MAHKLKFKPEITRVKLNPEQAVLTCYCWDQARIATGATSNAPGAQFACYESQGQTPPVKTIVARTLLFAASNSVS